MQDLPLLSDNNNININLCPSSSNHNDYDTIVNTNLPSLEYDQNFSLLSEDNDDFNMSISLPFENESNISGSSYQYNLYVGDHFDNWLSVDSISCCKSFCCSSSGIYAPKKVIDQNSHRIRVKCTTLVNTHNYEINPTQICNIVARYRRLSKEMIQDIKFYLEYKVAPIAQLEMLKKNDRLDSISFLDILFEKMFQNPCWKVFIRHSDTEYRLLELYRRFSDVVLNNNTYKTNKYNMYLSVFMIKDNYGKFRNVANALVEDELSSTYVWILQYLSKVTNNVVPKSFWTDAEPGLINAVSQVFPDTHHFYCLFHIWQNVIKHLKASLECEHYMFKKLYANRFSLAKAYTLFQFNTGIQSTQSIESFNNIIKKSLNSASTLCELEEAIDKRHEEENRYCKLTDLKSQHTTIGLPHISSQFFLVVDNRFQISQSFTYEGQKEHLIPEDLYADTINSNFIEDITNEPQAILKAILSNTNTSNIVEMWKVRRIGGLLHQVLENSPSLIAIESSTDTIVEVNLNLQSLRNFQAKTAINIALEIKNNDELVQLLKNFISAKRNPGANNNSNEIDENGIITLNQHLIDQTSDPHVTKIRGAPRKKRIKSAIEMSKMKTVRQEITNRVNNIENNCAGETSLRQQRKRLLCEKPGHYQKKCPSAKEN
ncbi:13577_t:CDS:10 [Gigaspora margarita]|uniref:13577_t:CDS:1 n=1 Tax=Gigaspora margarita TaxID=4874 RepID=A0ABN7USU6_GIGMA|nr:13577_t:CDS:10 [Gigaspora margarita]